MTRATLSASFEGGGDVARSSSIVRSNRSAPVVGSENQPISRNRSRARAAMRGLRAAAARMRWCQAGTSPGLSSAARPKAATASAISTPDMGPKW